MECEVLSKKQNKKNISAIAGIINVSVNFFLATFSIKLNC